MFTGGDIHDSIVDRIYGVRDDLDDEERRLARLQREVAQAGERRCASIRALAEFHLPGMNEEAVADTLAEMEASIRGIFDRKKRRVRAVERRITKQRDTAAHAEAGLAQVTQALNETGKERARLARVVFEELQSMPRWQQLFEKTRRLEARVAASEKRHEAARREQSEKAPAYKRDRLFSYLSRRRYGTRRAVGNALTRHLDRWVAGVIEYDDLNARYEFLKALPEHAAAVLEKDREALAAAVPPLATLEEKAIDRHGLTPVLERGEKLYAEREEARQALRKAETTLRELTDELAALQDERGAFYQSAIASLEDYLGGCSLDKLMAIARTTGDPRDDELVAELREIDEHLAGLVLALSDSQEVRSRLAGRLAGLEQIRDSFEAYDWNGYRSRFDGGLDISGLLLGYMAGRHTSGHVQRVLGRSQHFTPVFDSSGGGSSGGRSYGGAFSSGSSSSRGGGFSSGGGGFFTGGGFGSGGGGGGGGFTTGGGF